MKKKLYGSVLLIGGGLGFSQSSVILQSRLESSLPAQFSKGADTVEVSSNPRVSVFDRLVVISYRVGYFRGFLENLKTPHLTPTNSDYHKNLNHCF